MEKHNLELNLRNVDPVNSLEVYADLKIIGEISQSIDGFIQLVSSMLTVKHSDLRPANYQPLLGAMGFEEVSFLTDLIKVALSKSVEKRELLLDEYITKYPPNTFYYTSKAVTYTMSGKFEQAKFNYLQAIKLKPNNYEALNNLGLLYQDVFQNISKAQEYFENAIKAEPKLTVARLNLAILRSRFFNDEKSAKFQYDRILSYDPKEPKAHNNLGNYYRGVKGEIADDLKAEYHYKKAIELNPEYIEAYINYGNFLKTHGKLDAGDKLYKKALELDLEGKFAPVINALLNSLKG